MLTPVFLSSEGCWHLFDPPKVQDGKANLAAKVLVGIFAFDSVVFITSLVVGILGATSVIHLSSALSYSLIGVSGLCVLSYGIMTIKHTYLVEKEDGSSRLSTEDLQNYFKMIPKVIKASCTGA